MLRWSSRMRLSTLRKLMILGGQSWHTLSGEDLMSDKRFELSCTPKAHHAKAMPQLRMHAESHEQCRVCEPATSNVKIRPTFSLLAGTSSRVTITCMLTIMCVAGPVMMSLLRNVVHSPGGGAPSAAISTPTDMCHPATHASVASWRIRHLTLGWHPTPAARNVDAPCTAVVTPAPSSATLALALPALDRSAAFPES